MKQKKKSKDTILSSDINASNVCQQLEISFKNFQHSESKPNSIEFTQFIKDFEVFLKEETNTKLLNYFTPIVIQNITVHVCSFAFEPNSIRQLFHLFNLIVSKTGVIFSSLSYMTLFLFLSNGDEERFNILKNERISIDIFSNEFFFKDFIDGTLFNLTFQKLFLTVSSKEICQFYTNLIFKVSPINLLSNYNYQPIIDHIYQQSPNEAIFPELSVFLAGLFSINSDSKFKYFFNDKQNFEFLSEFLNDASIDTIIECFTYLIFIEPPNFSILKNIVDFYKKNLRIQNQFFDSGFKLIQLHPEIAIEINSIVPLSSWVTSQTSISQLIFVIKLMNSINTSLVSQFLTSFFSLLSNEVNVDFYLFGIDIVESQIFHHHINLLFLLNSLFLKVFVIQISTDMLCEIFEKSSTFAQLVYDIYSLPEAESIRHDVLSKIIQIVMKNSELISIVSGFFTISGTPENLREIMNLIETSKNGNFCEALSFSFLKSDVFAQNFLRENGLNFIDSIFNQKIIDIQMVKKLIMGLTQRLSIQKVDDFIESLPNNHPLFSLDENDLLSLIYGFETHLDYFPIKIYSLFHLIPCPTKIDPYNSSILGKNKFLKKIENFMDLPIINDIGNRYITDDFFYQFLQKQPTQLERFADPSYDHFPLFQIFEYSSEKVYDMKFNSISFWFRFNSKIDDSLKVPFFHASKFSLFIKKNILFANYEGVEYEVPIDPLKWNHIFVSISPKVVLHKIKIYVNLNKAVFTSLSKMSEFEDFGFLVFSSLLFIGPAIRIYENKTKEFNKIFELGPSSFSKLNEDHLIVPSSDFLSDKNMLPVLYYGFPEHFKSEKKLNYFFEILKKSKDDADFDNILALYFKVFLILKNSNINLFYSLLNFFASNPEKLSKERFCKVLNFFGNYKNKNTFLNEILQNKRFWKNVPNDLIICSLISYFKSFDFYEGIDKFQFFLSSKIILNPKSKSIISSFLNYSKELPKCLNCVLILFLCHHYIYQKQNKEIQCEIQSIKKSNTSNNEEEEIQIDQCLLNENQRNVSIQCEINFENLNSSNFNEQFSLFQKINNSELQFNMIDCFYDFLNESKNIEIIKSIFPIDDFISIFIVSQNSFKLSLFKIFVLIEKKSPGLFMVNNLFLTAFFPLFIYQNIWDEVMNLIIDDENEKQIKNTPMISLILALIWSLTVVSLHSISQTGKKFQLSFNKEIKFCLSNVNVIAMNKSTQNFIITWYPLLFGFENNKSDNFIQSIKIENKEINPPKVSDFSHQIWKNLIQSARQIDNNLPMKTDKFYIKEFRSFIPNSYLILFLINVILSSSKIQFIHLFSSLLSIPLISEKEVSETFVCQFVTSFLTILSQTSKLETLITPFFPILHYISSCGLMKFNFQFILSSIFVIVTRLHDLYLKSFKKDLQAINNLLINILSNCDNETLPALFNILQQNVDVFSEIVQLTNTTDLYLSFFKKFASASYKDFDLFFKRFLEVSKIDKKNKKVDELINHIETQDNSLMNKWNKVLNSVSSIAKMVKNEKINCFSSMISELAIESKEISKIYFIFQQKQNEFSQFLMKNFNSAESIHNLQDYFNYSIENKYESIIDSFTLTEKNFEMNPENKKLIPFSFPLNLPRLFVPTPIHSQKELIDFVNENKLYSKNTELNSNEKVVFVSEKMDVDSEKSSNSVIDKNLNSYSIPKISEFENINDNDNDNVDNESEKSTRSIFKKKNKRTFSYSVPKTTENDVENENDDSQSSKEKKKRLNRRQSKISDPCLFDLKTNPVVMNCHVKRLGYSIPVILSLTTKHIELIPLNCSKTTNVCLNADFLMEVINGFWGKVTVFDGKIFIKIQLNSIISIHQIDSKSFIFWTMKCGTFVIDGIESGVFEKKPFSDLRLFTSHDLQSIKNEAVQKWTDGRLSTSQLIVLLNICEGNYYVDKNMFIQFPEHFNVFGTFSPINESLHSNLIEGKMIGNEFFSNSIELKENVNSIVDFIKKFDISCQIENLNRPSPHFTINSEFLCQKISGPVPSFSLFDSNSIIKDLPPLSARVSDTFPIFLIVDRNESTVYLINIKENKKIYINYSEDFAFAKSIFVSKKFMFFAIDLENDNSLIYQIECENGRPSRFEFVNKNSFLYDQITSVNDTELLAATFSGKTVYIWPLYRFSYHRIINFESKIRFFEFDDNSGTFWICDNFSTYLFDLNGKLFSSHKFEKEISAFTVVNQPIFECERCAICGFYDGSVSLISPKIESGELFEKELKKCHQSKIVRIVFNTHNDFFLTIDDCQNAFFWTEKNVGEKGSEFDINIFECCPLCGNKPFKFCSSCKRAFCAECLKDTEICPDCSHTQT